jgi:hypothetical protein
MFLVILPLGRGGFAVGVMEMAAREEVRREMSIEFVVLFVIFGGVGLGRGGIGGGFECRVCLFVGG